MVRIKPEPARTKVICNLCDQLIGWEDELIPDDLDFGIKADGWLTGYAVDGSQKHYPFDYCPECAKVAIKAFKKIRLARRES